MHIFFHYHCVSQHTAASYICWSLTAAKFAFRVRRTNGDVRTGCREAACVCAFVSVPAGLHLCSVNNSGVRPAGDKCLSREAPHSDSLPFLLPHQPVITLEGSVACTFSREGINTVTVQVSAGNSILQDRKTIAVHGESPLRLHLHWDCVAL